MELISQLNFLLLKIKIKYLSVVSVMYTYKHTHTHTHIYIYIYIYIKFAHTHILMLRMFKNRVLRQIFQPIRDENGEWWRLHTGEIHSLYHSPNILSMIKFRILRWVGHVARMQKVRVAFKILASKSTGLRSVVWWKTLKQFFVSRDETTWYNKGR